MSNYRSKYYSPNKNSAILEYEDLQTIKKFKDELTIDELGDFFEVDRNTIKYAIDNERWNIPKEEFKK